MSTNTHYDVIILGGGINGCGIARELSAQGLKVLLLERGTIGCGTSSQTSKLIHGGLRYLENWEFSLVREALHDRARLIQLYPDLVAMKSFYLPMTKDSPRPAWLIAMGLTFYDVLTVGGSAPAHTSLSPDAFSQMFPAFKNDVITKAFAYSDAVTDDLALTRRVAEDAKRNGATIAETAQIGDISPAHVGWKVSCGEITYESKLLLNATGPWIDEVNERYGLPSRYRITKVSGIHIVVPQALAPQPLFLQTEEQRIFFMLPRGNGTYIGTTERLEQQRCDDVVAQEEDRDYLIRETNRYIKHEITRADVQETWLGIRPLIEERANPAKISREYRFDVQRLQGAPIFHVFGGKLTTFLSLAEKAARMVRKIIG